MRKAQHVDQRNYDKEAREMLRDLSDNDLYKMYDIVMKQKQRSNSEERDRELLAVQKAIESTRNIDKYRLLHLSRGYKSSMAHDAGLGDLIANNNPKRKKS